MRGLNSGSIFFFIFIAMMLNGMGIPFGLLIPIFIFFTIASSANKQQQSKRKSGHVRESTRRRRAEQVGNRRRQQRKVPNRPLVTRNPFKKSGIEKYKDYDYDGAIEDFTKALQIEDRDPAVHFNLGCAYSLTEQKDLAYKHLAKAVQTGFKDTEKIKTHDALAFLRVQDDFETFVASGYRWPVGKSSKRETTIVERPDLLQQLNQLAILRDKGLLSAEEFEVQKKKLLR